MITVRETVCENGQIIHESTQEWKLKSRFIDALKHLPISSHCIYDLAKNNSVTFEKDGIERTIEIIPKIELVGA